MIAYTPGAPRAELGKDGQLVLRSEAPLRRVATVNIRVPMEFKVRGGRKEIVLPPDAATAEPPKPQQPLVLALAKAHQWQKMIESGDVGSLDELARENRVDPSYVARILRLATLAPDIVEAILNGREPSGLSLRKLTGNLPLLWEEQRTLFGFVGKPGSSSPDTSRKSLGSPRACSPRAS